MQPVSTQFTSAINTASSVYSLPKVIADFNMNISATVGTVANAGADIGGDPDYFPISSIVQGNRPITGSPKAKIGQAKVTSPVNDVGIHYNTSGKGMLYKYWSTNNVSAGSSSSINGTTAFAISGVSPYVIYASSVWCNKIQLGFDITFAKPKAFNVSITTDGTTWTSVASNQTISSSGQVILYLQNDSSWSETVNDANQLSIKGVRVDILGMNIASVNCNVIEISARLEKDLSADIVDMQVTKSIGNPSLSQPFGLVSANEFSLTLDNSQGTYINTNSGSLFNNILTKNVKLTAFLGISPSTYVKSDVQYVQQGVFYVDTWGDEAAYNAAVTATDFTKFLQTQALLPTVYQNKNAGHIIRIILNSMGFRNFSYWNQNVKDYRLPFFWHTTTDMAWDVITTLCTEGQSIVFFDEFETCQYVTRNAMTTNPTSNSTNSYPPVSGYGQTNQYNLTSVPITVGGNSIASNIIDMSHSYDTQVNQVIVNYQTLSINKDIYGRPLNTSVWTPTDLTTSQTTVNGLTTTPSSTASDDVSIMSGYLSHDMTNNQLTCLIDPAKAELFGFSGYLNIDGEVMAYNGKEYAYYPTTGNTPTIVNVFTQDDVNNINDNLTALVHVGHSNHFTGKLILTARGQWGTTAIAHTVAIGNWTGYKLNGTSNSVNNGIIQQHKSTLTLKGNTKNTNDLHLAKYTGTGLDDNWIQLGTQVLFPKRSVTTTTTSGGVVVDPTGGKGTQAPPVSKKKVTTNGPQNASAGMVVNLNSSKTGGLYIDIKTTEYARKIKSPEVTVFVIDPIIGLQIQQGKGANILIAPEVWYSIDVSVSPAGGGTFNYAIYINSVPVITFQSSVSASNNFGVWGRADTEVRFEYFYAVSSANGSKAYQPALYGLLDRISGGYISNSLSSNVLYKRKKKNANWSQWYAPYFDDFGPYAHEIREFNVLYDSTPCFGPQLYISNDKYLEAIHFNSNAFGATFYVANKNRDQIKTGGVGVMQGTDTEDTGSKNAVTQTAMIYGYVPTQSNQKTLTVNNQTSINNFGVNQLTFDSQWTQTDSEARDLANWCTTYWGFPVETLSGDIWINPATQILDAVYVNYPLKGIAKSFYMTEIVIGWSSGGLVGSVTIQAALI